MPNDRWVRSTQLALRPHGALLVAYRTLTYAAPLYPFQHDYHVDNPNWQP